MGYTAARWQVSSDAYIGRSHGGAGLKWNVTFFYMIACAPLWVTRTQAGTHWRPLSLDINLTQMCPQQAGAHEWMNTRASGAAVTAKPSARAACRRFHYRTTLLPLPLRWWLIREWNVTFLGICMPIMAHVCEHAPCPRLAPRNTFTHVRCEDGSREMCRWLDEFRKSLKCDRQPILHSAIRHIWSHRLGAGRWRVCTRERKCL